MPLVEPRATHPKTYFEIPRAEADYLESFATYAAEFGDGSIRPVSPPYESEAYYLEGRCFIAVTRQSLFAWEVEEGFADIFLEVVAISPALAALALHYLDEERLAAISPCALEPLLSHRYPEVRQMAIRGAGKVGLAQTRIPATSR